jgi:hypothetical protein
MEDFGYAKPISIQGKTSGHLNRRPNQLVESIIASICGASLPAIIFYCFI